MNRWPRNKAYFWEQAPFFRALLPLAAGIWCYDRWLPAPGSSYALVIGAIALSGCLLLPFFRRYRGFYRILSFLLLNMVMLSAGYALSYLNDAGNDANWFWKSSTGNTTALARITDEPAEKENTWKVPVTFLGSMDSHGLSPATGRGILYLYKDRFPMLLHKGDTVFVPGQWQGIKNAGNPFEFDYATYCRRNNIARQQFCSPDAVRLYAANDPQQQSFITGAHDWCMRQLALYLPDAKVRGLVQAMLLGDETNLDPELLRSYSETGIVHIIAISGGNVTIFFVVIGWLLWWLKDKRHLWVKYAIALPLVWLYVVMAGAPSSAMRAAVMFTLLALGIMLQKNNNGLNQLFTTAFVLLCGQPMWLFSVGFQLSFVAMLSLILFYTPVHRWYHPKRWQVKKLWDTVAASIAAEVLVAPLVIFYFHIFPLLFVVANAAAFMFMFFVLVLSIVIIASSFIPVIASFTGFCVIGLVTVFDRMVTFMQGCNPASFRYLALTGLELALVYLLLSGLLLFALKKRKPALFSGLCTACLLLACLCRDEWIALHQHRLVAYNTGKASHIELISGGRYTVLYTDSLAPGKTEYAVKPAHTGWRCWRSAAGNADDIYSINGKSVLILNRPVAEGTRFHADYVVVNYDGKVDAAALRKVFSPVGVVISNNFRRQEQERLKRIFAGAGLAIHCTGLDGAFVCE